MASDIHSAYQQQNHVNASNFFINMRKKAKELADQIALERTSKMLDILRHRKIMENAGGALSRWPKWDGIGSTKKSKRSYSFWEAQERPNGEFWLVNRVTGSGLGIEQYNYPRSLATGKGWPSKIRNSDNLNRLVRKGDLIFSKQMPNGLDPWLKRQRELFEKEMKEEFKKRGIK